MQAERWFAVVCKGLWIGSTMTVPGVSGGTMAVLVGIYEKLIFAVNGLLREPKKHILFLSTFVMSAGAGFLLLAGGITLLLENNRFGGTIRFFFCGIVAGGIPFLLRQSGIRRMSAGTAVKMVSGVLIVSALGLIPTGLFTETQGIWQPIIHFAAGIPIAIALVLPGISVTHMLYVMGLYEDVMNKAVTFQWLSLLPLILGVGFGIWFTTGLLERLLKKYTADVYAVILGFVAGSVWELVPKTEFGNPIMAVLAVAIGFAAMYLAGKKTVVNNREVV